jgi:hypothetical protein
MEIVAIHEIGKAFPLGSLAARLSWANAFAPISARPREAL